MATDWTQEHRLKRLMLFRVVMITTLLLIAIYVETVSETLLPVNPLYFLIAGTYGLTLVYALALRFLPFRTVQVYVQVIFDLLVITGLIYLTGGPGNRAGFMLLYPISVLSGSVLLYRRKSLVLAGVATLLYAGMLWAVRDGWIAGGQALADVPAMPVKHVLYSIFVTGVACATVAQPLKESGVFPPMVVQMIGVGEQTGALDAMLSKIADFYEDEVDQAVANLLTLMEPVMIAFLGV
ncbi:MAG TPA: type II secretion system F family protein, partial [Vicinamibacteria bacterium]|nr:type II secretion system F family protein [Vicinamibacteria bacterium]